MPRLAALPIALLLALLLGARAAKLPTPPAGYAYWGIHAGAPWYASDAQSEMLADEARVGRKFGSCSRCGLALLTPTRR